LILTQKLIVTGVTMAAESNAWQISYKQIFTNRLCQEVIHDTFYYYPK